MKKNYVIPEIALCAVSSAEDILSASDGIIVNRLNTPDIGEGDVVDFSEFR